MGQMNHSLAEVETLFMPTNPLYSFLSSSLVKEVALFGGDISGLVPSAVIREISSKLSASTSSQHRPANLVAMDIPASLDELTTLLETARAIPMSAFWSVNRVEMLGPL